MRLSESEDDFLVSFVTSFNTPTAHNYLRVLLAKDEKDRVKVVDELCPQVVLVQRGDAHRPG